MKNNFIERDLKNLFKKAKNIKSKHKLTAKQMDEDIEKAIIKS